MTHCVNFLGGRLCFHCLLDDGTSKSNLPRTIDRYDLNLGIAGGKI
jgi:hypothetical protein